MNGRNITVLNIINSLCKPLLDDNFEEGNKEFKAMKNLMKRLNVVTFDEQYTNEIKKILAKDEKDLNLFKDDLSRLLNWVENQGTNLSKNFPLDILFRPIGQTLLNFNAISLLQDFPLNDMKLLIDMFSDDHLIKLPASLLSCGSSNQTIFCEDNKTDFCQNGKPTYGGIVLSAILLPGLIQAI